MFDPAPGGRKIVLLALVAVAVVWGLIGVDLFYPGFGLPEAFSHDLSGLDARGGATQKVFPLFGIGLVVSLFAALAVRQMWRFRQRAAEQLFLQQRIVDQTAEAMMVIGAESRIVAVNPAFERITGYPAGEAIGRSPALLDAGRHGPDFYPSILARAGEAGAWEGETWGRRKAGEVFPKRLRIRAVGPAGRAAPTHYVAAFSDISAQKAQEARIEFLAHHDPLTGLPNRLAMDAHLDARVASAARSQGRLAVLIIDLDNFKTVNDSLGHHAGDSMLAEIGRRLQGGLDDSTRVFRLGGDEFAVVVDQLPHKEAAIGLVQRLARAIAEPCLVDGQPLHASSSIGISLYPEDGGDAETLVRNADTAMYYAKAAGRNNYQFFAEPMNVEANRRLHLESDLWQGLAEEQFVLHYQPQIDLVSGKVVGVEALARWHHPERGMIPPAEFIPIAEACGLILPLGHWVLLTACRQAMEWLEAGVEMGEMAVNISAHQFRQPEFADSVETILRETGLPPGMLELEITESTVMSSADTSVDTLHRLKQMGVKLAIDDFGTGYSSLSYLRRLPVDRLKIDRAFVADVESDADAASLVSSIVALGRSMGLSLVAEGVENSGQADFLRALDCQRVQGFHFFHPVPAEQVVELSEIFRRAARQS